MSDAFEDQARALAWNTRPGDITSESSVQAIAIALRETWRMATAASDEELSACKERCRWAERRANEAEAKIALLEQTIQNGAEMIRAAHARAEAAGEERRWCQDNVWPVDNNDGEPTEYVRADIVDGLVAVLKGAREDILSLKNARGCEFGGTDEDWVGEIESVLSSYRKQGK